MSLQMATSFLASICRYVLLMKSNNSETGLRLLPIDVARSYKIKLGLDF